VRHTFSVTQTALDSFLVNSSTGKVQLDVQQIGGAFAEQGGWASGYDLGKLTA
jgi:hypothetical protein